MMDVTTEHLVKLADVARQLRVHRTTVHRWSKCGLEVVRLGNTPYTSREALARFSQPVEPGQPVRLQKNPPGNHAETERAMSRLSKSLGISLPRP